MPRDKCPDGKEHDMRLIGTEGDNEVWSCDNECGKVVRFPKLNNDNEGSEG